MIEYVYRGDNGWANIKGLQFHKVAEKAGILGIEPYSINSGFIAWHGNQPGFAKALDLIKSVT